jgi:hypothetical protein
MATAMPLDFAETPRSSSPLGEPTSRGLPPGVVADLMAGRHAAQAGQPQAEPDRSVWRILSFAPATSDEQLCVALPDFTPGELVAARSRVADRLHTWAASSPGTLAEMAATDLLPLLAEPTITLEEAVALGLMDDLTAEPACASPT